MKSLLWIGAVACRGVVVGYYAPWNSMSVSEVPYEKLTHVLYSFGFLEKSNPKPTDIRIKVEDEGKLKEMVELARPHETRVLLSVGGWTGSQTFSDICANEDNREDFTTNAISLIKKYDLDGIDLDWEFPTKKGYNNSFSPMDSINLGKLASHMRKRIDKEFENRKLLTASVPAHPYFDEKSRPIKDLSHFAKSFHFVNIMGYSIMGAWSESTGPNAPLFTSEHSRYSLDQAIRDWRDANFPLNQLNAGFAFFGSIQRSKAEMSSSIYSPADKTTGLPNPATSDPCEESAYKTDVFSFACLRKNILKSADEANKESGFRLGRDLASATPWLYHSETKRFVSYDDPKSITAKLLLSRCYKTLGVMLWDITQDHDNELIDAATQDTQDECAHFVDGKYTPDIKSKSKPKSKSNYQQ